MNKIRVYELAKKIGISSKDLVQKLKTSGVDVKNHMSSVDINQANKFINNSPDPQKNLSGDSSGSSENNLKQTKLNRDEQINTVPSANIDTKKPQKNSSGQDNASWKKNLNGRPQKENAGFVPQNLRHSQKMFDNSSNGNRYPKNKNYIQSNSKNYNITRSDNKSHDNKSYKPYWKNSNTSQATGPQEKSLDEGTQRSNSPLKREFPYRNKNYNRPDYNHGDGRQRYYHNQSRINASDQPQTQPQNLNNYRSNSSGFNNDRRKFASDRSREFRSDNNNNNNNNNRKKDFGNTYKSGLNPAGNYRTGYDKQSSFKKPVVNNSFSQLPNNSLDAQNRSTENKNKKFRSKDKNKYKPSDKTGSPKSRELTMDDLNKIKKPSKNKKTKPKQKVLVPEKLDISVIKIPKNIALKDLAEKINKPVAELIKLLMTDGLMVTQNQIINFDLASRLTEKFNIISELVEEIDLFETELFNELDTDSREVELSERPPIVVVMGHVDHGKTSLLDAIRHTDMINNEAGGITQHIGAYTVSIAGKQITFLDTPGHEAFTAMRMRGALATDIAVLVVAADDGIMPQTIEAINHAKAAGVEIVVAINKIDKPGANVDRVKQELVEYGLVSEDWGGKTICVPVSAKNNIGIDNLLEMIILVAELHELKANKNKKASGIIIEAKLDKGRGPIATALVQNGTLEIGNPMVAGESYGKVRAMIDDKGNRVKKALPSTPVEILGLSSVPNAGDSFYVTNSEKQARQLAESVISKNKVSMLKNNINNNKISLDDLFEQIKTGDVKDLAIIVKADVQGSVEAIKNSLERLSNEQVKIKTIHGGVGAITESDIMLASASNAIVIGFNVRPDSAAKSIAESENVDVRLYRIIYDAIEDIKSAMKGLLDPVYKEKIIGHAEVRQLFKVSSLGTIAGSYVTDGKVTRSSKIRVIRDGINIYEGEIATLKRFKDDVKEVSEGYECGILINKFNDIKEGDVLEVYTMEEIKQ